MTDKITQDTNVATDGQLKQIRRFIQDGAENITVEDLIALGLSKDAAQEVIKSGDKLHAIMREAAISTVKKLAIIDERFGPAVKEFEFTVPADYDHNKQIDWHAKKYKKGKTTYFYNDALSSKNFAKATSKLAPGKTYKARIFPILSTVTSEDCMNFLEKQANVVLVGGQGVTLVHDLKADEFPVGKWTASFDKKDALWKDSGGYPRVPGVRRYSGGDWRFSLGYFEDEWDGDHCLLCVCDISA